MGLFAVHKYLILLDPKTVKIALFDFLDRLNVAGHLAQGYPKKRLKADTLLELKNKLSRMASAIRCSRMVRPRCPCFPKDLIRSQFSKRGPIRGSIEEMASDEPNQ